MVKNFVCLYEMNLSMLKRAALRFNYEVGYFMMTFRTYTMSE